MPPPATSPAMREFGFGAKRALEPFRSPDDRTYQDPNVSPYFRLNQLSAADRNNIGYSDYARQQDNLVLREGQINDQMAAQQQKLQQDKRKVARLEQVQDTEDQANEALAAGVPVDQVIQKFPGLAQSPSFGNYMQQVRAVAPAQQTLAPHYRKMLKTPEERQDFDQAFQHFGNVTQADDHARAKAAERAHRVSLIEAGIPLESIEKAGPLNAERAALLKQQHKVSLTGGDPRAEKVFETFNKMVEAGDTKGAEAYRDYMRESQGIDIAPKPVVVAPAATQAATVAPAVTEEGFPTQEKVQQAKAAHIGAPDADENFYSTFIADPNTPLPQKKVALEKFKQFVKTAPPPSHLTLNQVVARRNTLDQAVEKAENEVQLAPELEKYNAKWSEAKNGMDQLINKTASRLGVSKQALVNSLVAGEGISPPNETFDRSRKDISIPELINQTWVDENPDVQGKGFSASMWERDHPLLEDFKKSKFANELGTKVLGFIPKGKTFGDVLDAYVNEQKARGGKRQSPGIAPVVVPQASAPKIVIGKPRKITQ